MEKTKEPLRKCMPLRIFIEPRDASTNEIVSKNHDGMACETRITYKGKPPFKVWETYSVPFIIQLKKNRINFGLDFEIYAEINGIIQKWQLYRFIGRRTKPVKEKKRLKKIAAKKA